MREAEYHQEFDRHRLTSHCKTCDHYHLVPSDKRARLIVNRFVSFGCTPKTIQKE